MAEERDSGPPDAQQDRPAAPPHLTSEYLAHVRHELRTPLNQIIGYSEMLEEEAADKEFASFVADLQKIQMAARNLLALVNESLQPEVVAQGRLDLQHLRHELRTPLNQIIGYSEMLDEEAQDLGQDGFVHDLRNVQTAARNLLDLIAGYLGATALSATPARPAADGAPSASTAPEHAHLSATARRAARHWHTERGALLVVDDNAMNRDMLSRRLERQGHAVTTAADGREALEIVRSRPIDLMLLDIVMPELDGYEVLEQLKSDATLRDVPVIMISGLDEVDSVVRCIEFGAEDYLTKPFDPVLLRARIGACLEKKHLRDKEVEYLRNVAVVTEAAGAVEAGTFDAASLGEVAKREDGLGQLARMFERMAREVQARETRLRQQVQELRIEIDQTKKARQVTEITESDFFQSLQTRARDLRRRDR